MATMDVRNPTIMARPGIASLNAVDQRMMQIVQSTTDSPARDAIIYHLQTGGQRMRAKLALASASIQLQPDDAVTAAAACELLHNASLIHDDISDRDTYRRGQETVRARFGEDIALCAGDLLMALSFQAALAIEDRERGAALLAALSDCAARVIGGQSVELGCQTAGKRVPLATYLAATRAKTAPLIELAIGIGLPERQKPMVRRLGEAIGLAYQILDDLDDLSHSEERPVHNAHLHPLHAIFHHRNGEGCLKHAQAALARAARDRQVLPDPLANAVEGLLEKLQAKATQHQTAPLTVTTEV